MKITAIPFLIGAWIGGYFAGHYDFALGATIVLLVLLATKQVDLI